MKVDDQTLVRKCLGGDLGAFEMLLDRYEKPIFNLALRMVNDHDDAGDITQTVFTKAYERLGSFDFRHKFYSWVYRIAINESLDWLQRGRRFVHIDEHRTTTTETPEESLRRGESVRAVQDALMNIKPEHRTVIVLRHFLNCSYREIGTILQISEKTVKSRLYTARRLLRDSLAGTAVL